MKESKHTPGPWRAVSRDNSGTINAVWDNCGNILADVYQPFYRNGSQPDDIAHETQLNNARLIASAPELLANLEKLAAIVSQQIDEHGKKDDSGWTEGDCIALDNARAVISKAKGGAL